MKILTAFLLLVGSAYAGQVTVDRISGTFKGGGGEFNVTGDFGVGGVAALSDGTFQTFCLERNEQVSPGEEFDYVVNTGAVLGGISGQTSPGFDPISPITAWMYSQFVYGTLDDYEYEIGEDREESAEALQNAIWFAEGELEEISGLSEDFYESAVEADPQGIGMVRALNLFQNGQHRQDQIFMEVPEPGVLVLIIIGLALIVIFRGGRK